MSARRRFTHPVRFGDVLVFKDGEAVMYVGRSRALAGVMDVVILRSPPSVGRPFGLLDKWTDTYSRPVYRPSSFSHWERDE